MKSPSSYRFACNQITLTKKLSKGEIVFLKKKARSDFKLYIVFSIHPHTDLVDLLIDSNIINSDGNNNGSNYCKGDVIQ